MRQPSSIQHIRDTIASLGIAGTVRTIGRNMLAVHIYYALTCPLEQRPAPSALRNGFRLQPAREGDFDEFSTMRSSLSPDDRHALAVRKMFFRRGFDRCFLLRDHQSAPVFLQWLIYPSDNPLIHRHYRHRFAPLPSGHAMLENAFCFPGYRGFGWLSDMTARLLWHAREDGHTWCTGYIRADNLPSLNCFTRLGFRLQRRIPEIKLCGITRRFI